MLYANNQLFSRAKVYLKEPPFIQFNYSMRIFHITVTLINSKVDYVSRIFPLVTILSCGKARPYFIYAR